MFVIHIFFPRSKIPCMVNGRCWWWNFPHSTWGRKRPYKWCVGWGPAPFLCTCLLEGGRALPMSVTFSWASVCRKLLHKSCWKHRLHSAAGGPPSWPQNGEKTFLATQEGLVLSVGGGLSVTGARASLPCLLAWEGSPVMGGGLSMAGTKTQLPRPWTHSMTCAAGPRAQCNPISVVPGYTTLHNVLKSAPYTAPDSVDSYFPLFR